MKRILLIALLLGMCGGAFAQSQASKVCRSDTPDTDCPAIGNDISNTILRTSVASASVIVTGTIQTRPPAVANSMVYKDAVGVIMTASNTYVSNTGTASESLIALNANVNVLNTNILQLTSSTLPTCNAASAGRIGLSGAKLCVCDGTSYKNLLGGTNLISGLLSGTCP